MAASTGPLYGPIPNLDPRWALVDNQGQVVRTPEQVRELIRLTQALPLSYGTLHGLSQAMAAVVALSADAVADIRSSVIEYQALENRITAINNEEREEALPLRKADVVEYSEEPLRRGTTPTQLRLQPLKEEKARLAVRICLQLDLGSFGLEAPCCSTWRSTDGVAALRRS